MMKMLMVIGYEDAGVVCWRWRQCQKNSGDGDDSIDVGDDDCVDTAAGDGDEFDGSDCQGADGCSVGGSVHGHVGNGVRK